MQIFATLMIRAFTTLYIHKLTPSLSLPSCLKPRPTSFTNPTPRSFTYSPRTACLHGLLPGPFLLSYSVFIFSFIFSFLSRALDVVSF